MEVVIFLSVELVMLFNPTAADFGCISTGQAIEPALSVVSQKCFMFLVKYKLTPIKIRYIRDLFIARV